MRIIIFLLSLTLLFAPLVHAKEKGNIQIYCQPKVKVFVNKRFKGKSNEKQGGYLIKNLNYGKYEIKLSRGKESEVFPVYLTDPKLNILSTKFARPDETFKTTVEMKDYNVSSNLKEQKPGKYDRDHRFDKKEYERIMSLAVDTIILDVRTSHRLMKKRTVDTAPVIIKEVFPISALELRGQLEGIFVIIEVLVNTDGDVVDAKIIEKSKFPKFDESVRVTVFKNKFVPAVVNNKRVAAWLRFQYED